MDGASNVELFDSDFEFFENQDELKDNVSVLSGNKYAACSVSPQSTNRTSDNESRKSNSTSSKKRGRNTPSETPRSDSTVVSKNHHSESSASEASNKSGKGSPHDSSKSASKASSKMSSKASSSTKKSSNQPSGSHHSSSKKGSRSKSDLSSDSSTATDISSLSTDSDEKEYKTFRSSQRSPPDSPTHKDTVSYPLSSRDKDIINSENIMRAMLSLNRERQRGMYKTREPWISPMSQQRAITQLIDSETEGNVMKRRLLEGCAGLGGSNLVFRPYHSTVNRQRQQCQIEVENKGMLGRLQQSNPTVGMRCTDQLGFYRVQSAYGVIPMDKKPFRGTRITFNPLRVSAEFSSYGNSMSSSRPSSETRRAQTTGNRKTAKSGSSASTRPPKTFSGALSSRGDWDSGW